MLIFSFQGSHIRMSGFADLNKGAPTAKVIVSLLSQGFGGVHLLKGRRHYTRLWMLDAYTKILARWHLHREASHSPCDTFTGMRVFMTTGVGGVGDMRYARGTPYFHKTAHICESRLCALYFTLVSVLTPAKRGLCRCRRRARL